MNKGIKYYSTSDVSRKTYSEPHLFDIRTFRLFLDAFLSLILVIILILLLILLLLLISLLLHILLVLTFNIVEQWILAYDVQERPCPYTI